MIGRYLLLLLGAVFCGSAWSQTSITLQECLTLAGRNSPALRAADIAVRASDLAKVELSRTALPQLKGAAGASYAPVPPPFGYDPALSNGGQVSGQVILQQAIFDGGVRGVRSDQLQLDAVRLANERRRTERDLTFNVRESFIGALRSQREVELQRRSVEQLEAYLSLVERLYHGGNASYTDLLKTQVQLSTATISLQKAAESLQSVKFSLAGLTGSAIDSSVNVTGTMEDSTGWTPDSLIALPVSTIDLVIARLGVERGLLEVELAHRERFPKISLVGDAGYLGSLENLRLPASERANALGYSIGIGIDVVIFDWGASALRAEQRQLEADALAEQVEALRRSLTQAHRTTRLQLSNARDRLRAARANVTKADENYVLMRSKYASGATLSLEVLSAQQLLTEVKMAELEALADIQLLSAKLEQLTSR